MKATELMINDWVLYGKRYAIAKRITPLRCDILVRITSNHDDIIIETYDNIDPIPLTAEILEKNGFEQTGDSTFSISDDGMRFYATWWRESLFYVGFYRRDNNSPNEHFSLNVRYVHELQHILRLCGMNELADNFKI